MTFSVSFLKRPTCFISLILDFKSNSYINLIYKSRETGMKIWCYTSLWSSRKTLVTQSMLLYLFTLVKKFKMKSFCLIIEVKKESKYIYKLRFILSPHKPRTEANASDLHLISEVMSCLNNGQG